MSKTGAVTMTRPAGRPKRSDREDSTVKIERSLAVKAKRISEHKGQPVAVILSELLVGPLNKAYLEMLRELDRG